MKYFADVNGLIATIDDQGQCNLPSLQLEHLSIRINADESQVDLIKDDGEIIESYNLWDNIVSLAVAIHGKVDANPKGELSIDTAVAIAHQSIEQYKQDWYKGMVEYPEFYSKTLPENNCGVFFEQMSSLLYDEV